MKSRDPTHPCPSAESCVRHAAYQGAVLEGRGHSAALHWIQGPRADITQARCRSRPRHALVARVVAGDALARRRMPFRFRTDAGSKKPCTSAAVSPSTLWVVGHQPPQLPHNSPQCSTPHAPARLFPKQKRHLHRGGISAHKIRFR